MKNTPKQILVIQTAFIGDVILATGLLEKLHAHYPQSKIDFLVRKGNESLTSQHPFLRETLVWDKKGGKYKNLLRLIGAVRKNRYDLVINVQRFANSGLLTALSKGQAKIGFDKNPFSWAFTKKVKHAIEEGVHEVKRNHELIRSLTDEKAAKPKLHPSAQDFESVKVRQSEPYICLAPTSVWFTKQYPKERWIDFIQETNFNGNIYLLGAPNDLNECEQIKSEAKRERVFNLCGKLSLLQSAALMKAAEMNFVNDSAPMHLASAVNAKTTAIFCSTVPEFGFGPLSVDSNIVQTKEDLKCRPCGLHGKKACPEGHFKCGFQITPQQLEEVL